MRAPASHARGPAQSSHHTRCMTWQATRQRSRVHLMRTPSCSLLGLRTVERETRKADEHTPRYEAHSVPVGPDAGRSEATGRAANDACRRDTPGNCALPIPLSASRAWQASVRVLKSELAELERWKSAHLAA